MDTGSPDEPVEPLQLVRLASLDELLATLAGVLDIRDVFARVSASAQRVIPHDLISLPLLTEDAGSLVIYAIAGNTSQFPETVPLPEHHRWLVTSSRDHLIHRDIQADPLERVSPPGMAGRARLVVPIRLLGRTLRGLDFLVPSLRQAFSTMGANRPADRPPARRDRTTASCHVRRARPRR
jgi:hypothetical protein